jgi:ABC-type Fe3+-siderophore transport system permease subunit
MFGAIKHFATFNNHPIKISAIFEEKTMLRKILAVIAGYMVFAISSVLLFTLSGHHPHQDAPFNFQLVTIAYGVFFSILAGAVVQLIAKQKSLTLNYILSFVMFALAGTSMALSGGSHWTQLLAMFAFAPVSIVGGYIVSKGAGSK